MTDGKYDALFIDFYGTLVTGDRVAVEQTCRRVVEDHGLNMTAADLAVVWGKAFFAAIDNCDVDGFRTLFDCECETLVDTVRPLAGPIDPRPYALMLKAYWQDPPPVPDAAEALRRIGLPVCVVSNADTEDILLAIERRKLPVDHVITSEDARSYKPDAVIFEKALEAMGVARDRVIHAGDSLHSDVGGARAVGLTTCWVCYEDRILDVGTALPDHKVSSLMQLRDLV